MLFLFISIYHVGCVDGSILLYDPTSLEKPCYKIKEHQLSVNKVECKQSSGNNIVISASRDGTVRLYDIRVNKVVSIMKSTNKSYCPDCWCVTAATNRSDTHSGGLLPLSEFNICAGYENGDVKFFDMRNSIVKYAVNIQNGVCSIGFDRKDTQPCKMICSTLEGNIYTFNVVFYDSKYGYSFTKDKVVSGTCWGTPFLPQNPDIFACLGGDGTVHLYKYLRPSMNYLFDTSKGCNIGVVGKLSKLNDQVISTQPIVSMDWHKEMNGLSALASLDQTLKVYIITKLKSV